MTTMLEIVKSDGVDTRWFQNRLADKRLSQRKLASHLHLDPAAVSLMIRGKRKISAAEAAEIARLLGVTVEEVLMRAGCAATIPGERQKDAPAAFVFPNVRHKEVLPPGMLELPVPLSDGGVALLRLPHRLGSADAERIAVLVRAFAVME